MAAQAHQIHRKHYHRVAHKSHPRYIGLVIEAAVLSFMFWVLYFAGDDSKPATRGDVRATAIIIVIFFAQLEQFGRHLREVRDLYRKPQ